jgi:hypothetical protein
MAAATAVSAYMQWKNSNDALKASQQEREAMQDLMNKIQDPNFDERTIAPEQIQVLQKYLPETVPYIAEVAPTMVKAASPGAMQGRQAQLDSLQYMQKMMQQGYDPQTAVEMARAQRAGAAESASARATAQAEAARRGFGGGPSFYQAGADQAGMDRMAMAQQAALADAAQRRMAAAGQASNLGGTIRGEDVSLEQANVNAINAFNQRQAAAQRDWQQQQANTRNQAQQFNIGEAQRVQEKNIQNAYDAARAGQQQYNTLAQQRYANAMGKVTGQMPMAQWAGQQATEQAAQQNKAIQSMTDLASKMAMEKYKADQNTGYQKG